MKNTSFIVIVTYNGMRWLKQCLDSCEEYPVIVVDNASTDKTVSFIETHYPHVTLFKQVSNLGFGQANNLGISYALEQGAEYVFLLNQDAYLHAGCIDSLIEVHKRNPKYGILSPIHLNGEGSAIDDKFLMYLNRYKVTNKLFTDVFTSGFLNLYDIEFVNAAGWLISRECIEKVGGFDPIFFHYGEDRNYCQRIAYHGFKLGVAPNIFIYHDRENRVNKKNKKHSANYYKEFERYLKIDWADVNFDEFDEKYDARARYLLNKKIRNLMKLRFNEAKDCHVKRKIMLKLKENIKQSRLINTNSLKPYI
ncbi:glycosyltransferase family 2 protein [Xanthomarina sp.]|uniref:glycosyltransferase family 2 protein n=1 Tax=Xanthomarina sp. TaxID=1931211 RepID=UPI002C9B0C8F|nr:glycosyltransferase family 2 protein [Xanthomarina sp.]HLV40542.1 glycosyltransferase family 2 protein [Xanthomarina sp.]